jgi:glucosyl-dolichyl phosphate glucuronosyltransferase
VYRHPLYYGDLDVNRSLRVTRRPDLSIVVCTYNRSTSLRRTLASLAAQATPPGLVWELLVVDNNSRDGTQRVIDDFAATASMSFRSLFVGEQGLSRARNAGVGDSRGDIVCFTDDDVDPAVDWVARIDAAISHDVDIVGGRILPAWCTPPPAWLDPSFHGAFAILDYAFPAQVLRADGVPCVWGANMAFRRQVFDTVGLFDTRRGLVGNRRYGGEEIDLVGRALSAGFRAVYDPSVVVWHRIGTDRARVRYVSRVYFERAECEARLAAVAGRSVLLDIPLGAYRSMITLVARWLWALALRRPDTIQRWLACCRALGSIWGAYTRLLTPPHFW